MPAFVTILNVVSWGAVVAFLVALVAAGTRRWHLASAVSRGVAVLGPLVLVASLLGSVILPLAAQGGDQPSTKAVVLSMGISEVANCSAPAVAASLAAALLWGISRRRRP